MGLTSNTINCIYKDKMNFIWIGTANGLNRFDGIDVSAFEDFNNKSVIGIIEQEESSLYVLTEHELYKYNRSTRKNLLIETLKDKSNSFKAFTLDRNGDLFFISHTDLYLLPKDKKSATKINEIKKVSNQTLSSIFIDNNNLCWISSSSGLIKYNIKSKEISISNNAFNNHLTCFTNKGKTLYIGTRDGNILSFNTQTNQFTHVKTFENAYIQTIFFSNNKLYIGTNGNGLKILDISQPSFPLIPNPFKGSSNLNINAIYSIFADNNSCWIGTFSGGISYITSQQSTFRLFDNTEKSLIDNQNIRSFYVDNNGLGIYGTRNGLICNTNGEPSFYNTDNTAELKSNIILSIYSYEKGKFLIGTYNGGLYLLDAISKKITPFKDKPIFCNNSFYSIAYDKKGTLWFGTLSGLIQYDISKNTYNIFDVSNSGIVSNDIYYILRDSFDRLWIGTKAGICYLEKGIIKRPTLLNAASTGTIRYIYEDSKKHIWFGSENQGAICISPDLKSIRQYSDRNVLPDNYVSSIIEDNSGKIWLTTRKGIVRMKSDSEYSIYSLYDGIPSYTFNDAAIQLTGNTIWWGNEKGLISVATNKIQTAKTSPISITRVVINGISEDVNIKNLSNAPEYLEKIILPASEKNLIFKFSDFKYDFPPSVIYEYKLEGYSENWQKTVAGKEIIISNIPSGRYTLKIREAGNNKDIKEITVLKEKSYIIYGMFFIVLAFSCVIIFYYVRYLKIKNVNRNIRQEQNTNKENKIKYQNTKLDKNELEYIKDAIVKYMEHEKPYLNPEFKLEEMASSINVSKIKISQVLNTYLDTNFSNFTSQYRIIAFKQKAKEGLLQQYTLSALARECGFSSRSSFFYSVKKLTGQTPAEFLKDAGIISTNKDNS